MVVRGLEPRLSKYLKANYKKKNYSKLIKHQLLTSDVDIESSLKFLNQ